MTLKLAPETWAQVRYEYEHTDKPVDDICADHGVSPSTLRDRMRRWRWTRRRPPIPAEGPPPARLVEQVTPFVPAVTPALSSSYLVDNKVPYFGWALSSGFCGNQYGFGFTGCLLPRAGSGPGPAQPPSCTRAWASSRSAKPSSNCSFIRLLRHIAGMAPAV